MTQLEFIKEEISKITDPMEMCAFLDSIQLGAKLYCLKNCKEEVEQDDKGFIKGTTILGMYSYLISEVPEK